MSSVNIASAPGAGADEQQVVSSFREISTPIISDSLQRLPGSGQLVPYHRDGRLVGPAFTVRTRPGDNLFIHRALDVARPGDVIVVDGGGELTNALLGELMAEYAAARGIAGFVIDGAVRDIECFKALNLPCFARGNTHRGPYKDGPGELQVPVSIAGHVVCPGDIVVADADGVVSFPLAVADELHAACQRKLDEEAEQLAEVRTGRFTRPWLDAIFGNS